MFLCTQLIVYFFEMYCHLATLYPLSISPNFAQKSIKIMENKTIITVEATVNAPVENKPEKS